MASEEFDYRKYLELLKKNKLLCIAAALLIMTSVTVYSYTLPNVYVAKSTVFIEKSIIAELLKGLTITPSADDKIRVLSYAMTSRSLITKVLDELDLSKSNQEQQESLIRSMQEHTQINIQDRGLFVISFSSLSPTLARDYVNALVRRYIEENSSSKREESYGATKFVSEQLAILKEKLDKAEAAVSAFKTGGGAVANIDIPSLLKEISDSQLRLDELRIRRAQLEAGLAGLSKVSTAQVTMADLQKRLQELQLRYTDSYPEIQRIKDEIQSLKEQLKSGQGIYKPLETPEYARIASELGAVRQAESNLSRTIARNRGLLQSVPAARVTLDNLEREKNSQKGLYEAMLAREGQSEVSKQMEVQDKSTVFRVVDPAVLPYKPVSPNRVKLILMGILAGVAGGVGLVLLKDLLDNSVKNLDLARQFGVPVLAVIPKVVEPERVRRQARRDRQLYLAAALYFSLILVVLASEVNGLDLVPKIISKLTS